MEFRPNEQERFDYLKYGIPTAFPIAALCVKDFETKSKRMLFVPGEDDVEAVLWVGGDFRVVFTNGRTRTYSKREIVYFEQ